MQGPQRGVSGDESPMGRLATCCGQFQPAWVDGAGEAELLGLGQLEGQTAR